MRFRRMSRQAYAASEDEHAGSVSLSREMKVPDSVDIIPEPDKEARICLFRMLNCPPVQECHDRRVTRKMFAR